MTRQSGGAGQKTVIERMAPPTFDVAVEIIDRHCWRVHPDVAQAVDALLRGVLQLILHMHQPCIHFYMSCQGYRHTRCAVWTVEPPITCMLCCSGLNASLFCMLHGIPCA